MSETSSLYTHIILPPHFTNNVSLPTSRSLHATFWLVQRHGPRQANLCWVLYCTFLPTCLSFPVYYLRAWIEDLYIEFPYPVKERINSHIICISSFVTWFVNFDTKTFLLHGFVLSENDSSFEQNNFVYSQLFRRAVLKMSCFKFQTDLASSINCQNFRPPC
jgi:hypothetical protein